MSTITDVTKEFKKNIDTIQKFYSDQQEYLSGTISSPPEVSVLAANLEYTENLTYSNINSDASQTLSMGSIADTIYLSSSILREPSIIYRTKADIYSDEDIALGYRSSELEGYYGRGISAILGRTTEQIGLLE